MLRRWRRDMGREDTSSYAGCAQKQFDLSPFWAQLFLY